MSVSRETLQQQLRAQAIELSGGLCEWPKCGQPGAELAHLHSTGAGGRKSAHVIENVAWLCRDHARISDGLRGSGGRPQYRQAHLDLFAAQPPAFTRQPRMAPGFWSPELILQHLERGGMGWERAEALAAHVAEQRGWAA